MLTMVTRVTGSRPKPWLWARCRPRSSPRQCRRRIEKGIWRSAPAQHRRSHRLFDSRERWRHWPRRRLHDRRQRLDRTLRRHHTKLVALARAGMDRANQLDEMRAFVPLSRDLIKDAPDWDDAQPITRAFEERLYDYYWLRPIGRLRLRTSTARRGLTPPLLRALPQQVPAARGECKRRAAETESRCRPRAACVRWRNSNRCGNAAGGCSSRRSRRPARS